MPHSIPAALEQFTPEDRAAILGATPENSLRTLNTHFPEWAHEGQAPPEGDWRTWVLMAGRGFGKTRAGAEWVLSLVRGEGEEKEKTLTAAIKRRAAKSRSSPACGRGDGLAPSSSVRIALVAATLDEARRVMVEGPSGILALARAGEVEEWSFARRTIRFAGGAEATLFSGAHPEGLRGPEHDFAWCDELAKWAKAAETWSNLQLGLRRGVWPRALVTTTPRRVAALRGVLGEEGVVRTGGGSRDNPHVPEAWIGAMERMHGGSLHGRQELGGELIEETEGALWPRKLIEACRVGAHPIGASFLPTPERVFASVVVGVDPPAGSASGSTGGNACGIVACGVDAFGMGYVIADHSEGGLSPEGWARKVAAAAEMHGAARVVAEANMGGRMVETVLRGAGVGVPVRLVHASESKVARAAPVAALFEAGRARFAGHFAELEDELAGLSWGGAYEGPGRSPDRADAMVWAMTHLMLGPAQGEPAVRLL